MESVDKGTESSIRKVVILDGMAIVNGVNIKKRK